VSFGSFRRIDETIQKTLDQGHGSDAFEPNTMPTKSQLDRLTQRSRRVIDRGIDADVVTRLTDFIAGAAPQTLSQMRPIELASALEVDEDDCVQACLVATAEGILTLRWDILCPTCRVSAAAESLLSSIKGHTHCVACDYDFRSDLGDAIELVFRVHPEIREADDAMYCIGGPEHSPHVVAQVRIEAGERIELDVSMSPGDYLIRGPRLVGQQHLRVRATPAVSLHQVSISELRRADHTPVLRAGRQVLTVTNDLSHLQIIRVERMIPRDNVMTATRVSTLPLFRELFPDQVMNSSRPIEADEMTLVATTIHDADAFYDSLGDREAYDVVAGHLEAIKHCVEAHRGTIAKTVGEGMLAAFMNCEQAVDAAIGLQASLADDEAMSKIRLSIAVHRGRTLVATMNQRLDYFGATARLVSALANAAEGVILLTQSVFTDPIVQQRLKQHALESCVESIEIPGKAAQQVERIRRSHAGAPSRRSRGDSRR